MIFIIIRTIINLQVIISVVISLVVVCGASQGCVKFAFVLLEATNSLRSLSNQIINTVTGDIVMALKCTLKDFFPSTYDCSFSELILTSTTRNG